MQETTLGLNRNYPIYNADGSAFHDLVIHNATTESVVMSLGDKLSGDVYYNGTDLSFTMNEYVDVDGVHYKLVSPPTIVREGMVSDNSQLHGMTKYSLVFYHPMYMLGNFPFTDVAVDMETESQYLSESKKFAWVGNLDDFVAKITANLRYTQWVCVIHSNRTQDEAQKAAKISEVFQFDNNFVSDALKKAYDEWEIPYTIEEIPSTDSLYSQGKRFKIVFGFPNQEILDENNHPFVFQFGQGVGLKNNSRTPKNNKIVTRIAGCGSEKNIPFGYPQIPWYGDPTAKFTYGDQAGTYTNVTIGSKTFAKLVSYPIYDGIMGGANVKLIKHPFTRKNLMPSVYAQTLFNKISPYAVRELPSGEILPNEDYDPYTELVDYHDAIAPTYPNPCDQENPCSEYHTFEDIKPELGEPWIVDVLPYDNIDNDPFETYISLDTFLNGVRTDLDTQGKITNENERAAITKLYNTLDNDLGATEFSSEGGSYTYHCKITKDDDFYYAKYTSDNINYDEVCLQRDHSVSPTWDDTMNDEGEYVQSYFKLKIPKLDFDLYACASITETAKINMRSGACIGCTFEIVIDWDDYKANFYHEDGTFDPVIHTTEGDGHVRDGRRYPDSSQRAVTFIVKKDIDTFGVLLPNNYQYPKGSRTVGSANADRFVILGISLPTSYITNAQQRLDSAMDEYMLENNVHYFEYPLKFDEYFLAQNTDILAQIQPNRIVRFRYNGSDNALYVKQMVVKYGDKTLPQYDITLTDDIEVVLNKIGQVTDDVSRMRVQMNEIQKYYSENIISLINEKLSKVSDDVAQGRITFQQGLNSLASTIFGDEVRSNNFITGLYSGRGWRIDNLGNAEMESLRVRSFLEIVELLINRMQSQEGDTMFTDNDQVDSVEAIYIQVTPQTGDNPKKNGWYERVNDAYVKTEDATVNVSKTYYDAYYKLSLKEKWAGYVTSQKIGNILKGIINTLAAMDGNVSDITEEQSVEEDGENKFYTSWMVIVDPSDAQTTVKTNQIVVRCWRDNEGGKYDEGTQDTKGVPAGKNFAPCELMTIARWGCLDAEDIYGANPTSEQIADVQKRQNVFYISTQEGRIVKLTRVCQPILYEFNYGTTLGILPDFVRQWSIGSRLIDGRDYLYAQGVVVGDFIKVDIHGAPIVNYVDYGAWQPNTRYLHNEYNSTSLQWETSDVWHNNAKWRCLVSQPHEGRYYEPTDANSQYWLKIVDSPRDGANTPQYTEEYYAWSNDPSTVDVTSPPRISGDWSESIPSQGNYSYLWKKVIRYTLVPNTSPAEYQGHIPEYYRLNGENGTTITTKGKVFVVIDYMDSSLPSGVEEGSLGLLQTSRVLYQYHNNAWAALSPSVTCPTDMKVIVKESSDMLVWDSNNDEWDYESPSYVDDGDAYTEDYTGHLWQWVDESSIWLDLGQFKGENGKTYYTHTAWATGVSFLPSPIAPAQGCLNYRNADYVSGGSITPPTSQSSQYPYMGYRIDEIAGTDSQDYETYTWQKVKGDKGDKGNKGDKGDKGDQGDRGKIGRFFYYGGDWNAADDSTLFVVNDAQAPYFRHYLQGDPNPRYHVFNPAQNPEGDLTMADMWAMTEGNPKSFDNAPWEAMTNDFKYLITEAIFANFANFGSAIISGDWMLSANGQIAGVLFVSGDMLQGKKLTSSGQSDFSIVPHTLFDTSNPTSDGRQFYERIWGTSLEEQPVIGHSGSSSQSGQSTTLEITENTTLVLDADTIYYVRVDCSTEDIGSYYLQLYNASTGNVTIKDLRTDGTQKTQIAFFSVYESGEYYLRIVTGGQYSPTSQTTQYGSMYLYLVAVGIASFSPRYAVDLKTGMVLQGYGFSSGAIRRNKVIIDASTFNIYTKPASYSLDYRELDFNVCGSFIDIREHCIPNLNLPMFCSSIPTTEDERNYARSFVGTKFLLYLTYGTVSSYYNYSVHHSKLAVKLSRDNGEANATYKVQNIELDSDSGTSEESRVAKGKFLELECVTGLDSDGEIVYWKVNTYGQMAGIQ